MKYKNKGFTLVELIVVIVILAILAAILVPALLGYIDKARQQQILVNAKAAFVAAQSLSSESYAKYGNPEDAVKDENIAELTDINFEQTKTIFGADYDATSTNSKMYVISEFYYQENGLIVRYTLESGEWVFVDEMGGSVNVAAVDTISAKSKSSSRNAFLDAHASSNTGNMIAALTEAGISSSTYSIYRPWYGSEYWGSVVSLPDDIRNEVKGYIADNIFKRPAFTYVITLDGSAAEKPTGTIVKVKKYWYTEYANELICTSIGTAEVWQDNGTLRFRNENYSSENFTLMFK